MDILQIIADELNVKYKQVENAVNLIDEGNTIPFIARYRKEVTGGLSDEDLRILYERLNYLRNLENRKAIQPQINSVLNSVMTKTNADRAFIIELHNGSNNLNGVPFLHGSVTYEKSRDGVDNIDEEYQNISLSRYEFATYLHNNFSYYGTIDELFKIDKKLAMKLRADGIVYVAVTTLHNGKYEWGWFGVLYGNLENVPQEREITNELMITSQNITNTLQVLQK